MLTVGAYYQELGSKEGPPFSYHSGDIPEFGEKGGFWVRHWVIF